MCLCVLFFLFCSSILCIFAFLFAAIFVYCFFLLVAAVIKVAIKLMLTVPFGILLTYYFWPHIIGMWQYFR